MNELIDYNKSEIKKVEADLKKIIKDKDLEIKMLKERK